MISAVQLKPSHSSRKNGKGACWGVLLLSVRYWIVRHPAFLLVGKSSKKKLPIWSAGMSNALHRPAISRAVKGSLPVILAVRVDGGMPARRAASACVSSHSAKRTRSL